MRNEPTGRGGPGGFLDLESVDVGPPGDRPDPGDRVAKTGTTAVGLTTADGVVLTTDMRTSIEGQYVLSKDTEKIAQVHPTAVVAQVGSVGAAQMFVRMIRSEANVYEHKRDDPLDVSALLSLSSKLMREVGGMQMTPLVAGVDGDGSHVGTVDPAGGVLTDDYVAAGSGMQVAYGTLEDAYEAGLSNEAAVRLGAEAVASASERDTASGNGVHVAEITAEGVDLHDHEDAEELL